MGKRRIIITVFLISCIFGLSALAQASVVNDTHKKPAFSFLRRFFKKDDTSSSEKRVYLEKKKDVYSSEDADYSEAVSDDLGVSGAESIVADKIVANKKDSGKTLKKVYIFDVKIPEISIKKENSPDGNLRANVECEECVNSDEPGKPKLPEFFAGKVRIPLEARNVKIEIIDPKINKVKLGKLKPQINESLVPRKNNNGDVVGVDYSYMEDSEFFSGKKAYPEGKVYKKRGNFRGLGFVDVVLNVAQYYPAGNELELLEGSVSIKVSWDEPEEKSPYVKLERPYKKMVGKIFLNSDPSVEEAVSEESSDTAPKDFNTVFQSEMQSVEVSPEWDSQYDLSCDGKVDLSDVGLFAQTYYKYGGEINAPERSMQYCADFNHDGYLDDADISYFAEHLGTTGTGSCCVTKQHISRGMVSYIDNPSVVPEGIDYLIVAADAFYDDPELRDFAEFRADQSKLHVAVVKTSDIYDAVGTVIPRDPQIPSHNWESEKEIKTYIKYVYDQGAHDLDYVLLVGSAYNGADVSQYYLPTRKTVITELGFQERDNDPDNNPKIWTDYYYSCLNNDNPESDNVIDDYDDDLDVMIGRFSVRDEDQLHNIITKTMNYPGDFKDKIAPRALLTSGFAGYESGWNKLDDFKRAFFNPQRVPYEEVIAEELNPDFDQFRSDVWPLVDEGFGLWIHNGHGMPNGWEISVSQAEVHSPDTYPLSNFFNWAINYFNNENRYPFVLSLACLTNFNRWSVSGFGENMTAKYANSGAVGFIGSTGPAYLSSSYTLMYRILVEIYNDEDYIAGNILAEAKIKMQSITHRMLYNLYGDPALNIKDAIVWPEEIVDDPPDTPPGEPDGPHGDRRKRQMTAVSTER